MVLWEHEVSARWDKPAASDISVKQLPCWVASIASTRTREGLEVHAWLDGKKYEKGRKVSDAEFHELPIKRSKFHGEWNYEIHPRD